MKAIHELPVWIAENLHKNLPVQKLADQTAMSVRIFERVFTCELGSTSQFSVSTSQEQVNFGTEPVLHISHYLKLHNDRTHLGRPFETSAEGIGGCFPRSEAMRDPRYLSIAAKDR
jgi:AraC-like DNA-binding protein